jgi:hypothetical protein
MILLTIKMISILQFGLYLVLDRTKFKKFKLLILLVILVGHLVVFPPMFYPQMKPGTCGMPFVAVTLAFWVLGGLAAIATHTIYSIISRWIYPASVSVPKRDDSV